MKLVYAIVRNDNEDDVVSQLTIITVLQDFPPQEVS